MNRITEVEISEVEGLEELYRLLDDLISAMRTFRHNIWARDNAIVDMLVDPLYYRIRQLDLFAEEIGSLLFKANRLSK